MTRGRGVDGWRTALLLLPIACAGTTQPARPPHEAAPPREPPPNVARVNPESADASTGTPESQPDSKSQRAKALVFGVLVRRWFHSVCVRPPPEPQAAPTVDAWYAPKCTYPGIPVGITFQDAADPLFFACDEQRKACNDRLGQAALRRVPKRAEVVIDRRGEAQGVTLYQDGRKLDDDDLEEAVLCFFAMLPGELAWELERCPGS